MSARKTNKYALVLSYLRAAGCKVRHRNMTKCIGTYNVETGLITIANHVKGTVTGVYGLFHERMHMLDHRNKHFRQFFRGYDTYKPEYMDEVIAAEENAAKFAQRMMKGIGLKYEPIELDPKEREGLLKFWRKRYFPD